MNLLLWFMVPCFECKHFVPVPKDFTYEHGQCSKFLKYADIARKDETKCGKDAKGFMVKESKESKTNKK